MDINLGMIKIKCILKGEQKVVGFSMKNGETCNSPLFKD